MCFSVTLCLSKESGLLAQERLSTLGPLHVDGAPGTDEHFYAWVTEDQSCGCSMLDPESDMDGDRWRLAPGIAQKMASTLHAVAATVAENFELVAEFSDELPLHERVIDLDSMLTLVEANQIQDRTKYRVTVRGEPAAATP